MQKYGYLLLLISFMAGCGLPVSLEEIEEPRFVPTTPALENLGPAPELNNDVWVNAAEPLRLADLQGKVVLLEMWTFG